VVDAMRFGQPPEFREHLERRMHDLGRERPSIEPAGAETDHFLLAIDDLERQVRPDPYDDHVERVRADVDGGYAHEIGAIAGSAIIIVSPSSYYHAPFH
jgi:hypothetical protein